MKSGIIITLMVSTVLVGAGHARQMLDPSLVRSPAKATQSMNPTSRSAEMGGLPYPDAPRIVGDLLVFASDGEQVEDNIGRHLSVCRSKSCRREGKEAATGYSYQLEELSRLLPKRCRSMRSRLTADARATRQMIDGVPVNRGNQATTQELHRWVNLTRNLAHEAGMKCLRRYTPNKG